MRRRSFLALAAGAAAQAGCASNEVTTVHDLARIYAALPTSTAPTPDPYVFLPGLLGSELTDTSTGTVLWGKFLDGTMNMRDPAFLRAVGLPMTGSKSLGELRDDVVATNVMINAVVKIGKSEFKINAYPGVIAGTLEMEADDVTKRTTAGDLRKIARNETPSSKSPTRPFAFDWRRDLSEAAALLDVHINAVVDEVLVKAKAEGRQLERDDVRIDLGAHSLGSQVARYYMRYGAEPLPDDGSLPPVTWAGAKHIRRVILIAPPNTGSMYALRTLLFGDRPMSILPVWPPALVCSYPAMLQLMPHPDLEPVLYDDDGTKVDLYDVSVWKRYDWGPFAPKQEAVLAAMIPEISDHTNRLRAAREFLQIALNRAAQLHYALDRRATPPPDVEYHLFASDALETEARYWVDRNTGKITKIDTELGDSVVTRASALGDIRPLQDPRTRLDSPIHWTSAHFSDGDHLTLLGDPNVADNLLYLIFQAPV